MAGTMKYFSGQIELQPWVRPMDNATFAQRFPTITGKRYDSFSKMVSETPDKQLLPVTRIIEYKKHPSLHKCDARCMSATGKTCECSCGGKNHGMHN